MIASSRNCGWVVVNTHPHREHIARDHLLRQDFHAYCPFVRKRVSHARRVRDVLRPLFPSYIFALLGSDVSWRPIVSTLGVRTLVRCGERLSYVPDGLVEALKAREIDGAIVRPANPYKVGQSVRIAGGGFDGLVATIIDMDEGDRLIVLMNILNRPVKVKLSSNHVIPVSL
jgi:transcriptional antiterminator RfaH